MKPIKYFYIIIPVYMYNIEREDQTTTNKYKQLKLCFKSLTVLLSFLHCEHPY